MIFPARLQRETYKLEATAQDKGFPPLSRSVEVQIDVVDRANNPPVWDHVVYGPIFIRENLPVGEKVVSVKARSVRPLSLFQKSNQSVSVRPVRQHAAARHHLVCLCTLHPIYIIIIIEQDQKKKRKKSNCVRISEGQHVSSIP